MYEGHCTAYNSICIIVYSSINYTKYYNALYSTAIVYLKE